MADRLLTVPETCERLHLSKPALYELLNSGELISFKIGRVRRIPESALEAFIADRVAAVVPNDAA